MSLYPSLEDMKVDQMMKAELQAEMQYVPNAPSAIYPTAPMISSPEFQLPPGQLYPTLGNYMGLEFNAEVIEQNMPEYLAEYHETMNNTLAQPENVTGMIAPVSGNSLGLQKSHVSHGIRQLILCKDKDGKIGLRVHAVNNGIFVCLVCPESPAAKAGLRFGDQILDINDQTVTGFSMDQVHKILRNASVNNIRMTIRDRPFERTITMHKDSTGHIGFQFKAGKIIALIKDSSAMRNGVLTDHQILEVNGKNVVGMKDKDLVTEIANSSNVVTITVIPSYIYEHMIKKMDSSLLKIMDHSTPV